MKSLFTVCMISTALALSAGTVSKVDKYNGYGHGNLAFNEQVKIAGDKNYYDINLHQSKPGKNGKQETFFSLSAPSQYWNFGRAPSKFLSLKVNGIPLRDIQPTPGSVTAWNKEDEAGGDFVLNFDGTRILLRIYMKPGSPLLFMKFTQPEKQIVPIKGSVDVTFSMVISRLLVNEKKQTIWNGAYNRQAQSETRLLKQQDAPITIEPADKYLIFSDEKLDGTDPKNEKGIGPCILVFDMKDGITGKLHMRNSYSSSITFKLPADFKEFHCAILQQKNRVSNADFMKKFNEEKEAYTVLK